MKTCLMIFMVTLISCSSKEQKIKAQTEWEGVSVSKIDEHPYFKNLPVSKVTNKSGIETWILKDQSKFQTDAYCQSLGGCLGMPIYNCNNIFSVKDNIILDFEQKGSCPGIKTIRQ
jgi:hypothetical protein